MLKVPIIKDTRTRSLPKTLLSPQKNQILQMGEMDDERD